ncbi:MAG: hypothetical protein K0R67_3563, partial [Paenibacillus sp.]|nr:hypothetical protein [Paenibacillus sp.]
MIKRIISLIVSTAIVLSISSLPVIGAGKASAKEARAAIVSSVSGTVMVTKAGGSNQYQAFEEMSLNQGDHIRTESGASLILTIVDQEDEVTIGENTEMYISSLVEASGGGKKSKLKIWAGSMWFKVKKLVSSEDEFEVDTPTAVMGVRGSNGFIESRFGQIFAIMASGVLQASPNTGSGEGGSSAYVYPGQQIKLSDDGADPSIGVLPLDIDEFIAKAPKEVIEKLITTIEQIREENEAMVAQIGDGTKVIDPKSGLLLNDQASLAGFGSNLNNLVANVAKSALEGNKFNADEMKSIIDKVNQSSSGEKIDLDNVKPFDKSIAANPDVVKAKEAELARLENERKAKLEEKRRLEEEKTRQNAALLAQVEEEKKKKDEANRQAAKEQKEQSELAYKNSLSDQEKAKFEADKEKGNSSTATPASTPSPTPSPTPNNGNDEPAPSVPIIVYPTSADITNAASVSIRVKGTVGSTVRLWNSSLKLDEKVVNTSGEAILAAALPNNGVYQLQVDAMNGGGTSSKAHVPVITIDRLAPIPPTLTAPDYWNAVTYLNPLIQVEAEVGTILNAYKGTDTTPFYTSQRTTSITSTIPVSLTVDGLYAFRVTATDAAGNTSAPTAKNIYLDKTPPQGTVSIKGAAGGTVTTNTVALDLVLTSNDQASSIQMSFSNSGGEETYSTWEPFSSTKLNYQLANGLGSKSVYMRLKDAAGNVSATSVNVVVTSRVIINDGASTTFSRNITLHLTPPVGAVDMAISEDGSFPSENWVAVSTTAS